MTESLDNFIVALREELTQYGELLALLESQQQEILARNVDEVHENAAQIHYQTEHLDRLKLKRETERQHLYTELELPDDASLKNSIALLPAEYQPLVRALIEDNHHSITRIRKLARQNHLLLNRSLTTVRQLVNSLSGSTRPSTYGGDGQLPSETSPQPIACDFTC